MGSYYKEERLEFLDSKGAFYNGNESDSDDELYNENNYHYFANTCYKIVSPILVKLINGFAVCKEQKHSLQRNTFTC